MVTMNDQPWLLVKVILSPRPQQNKPTIQKITRLFVVGCSLFTQPFVGIGPWPAVVMYRKHASLEPLNHH